MIAEWMIYCSLATLVVSVAAMVVERLLLRGRAPVRFVWIAAVALSTLAPIGIYRFAPRTVVYEPVTIESDQSSVEAIAPPVAKVPDIAPSQVAAPQSQRLNWTSALAKINTSLGYAWAILSFALACNFVGGIATLSLMRRRWHAQTVLGLPVLISEDSGPAVVGVLTPSIVIPKWVLTLDELQLALMLKHEHEHRSAGDGQVVTLARIALIVMPWNLALWYQMQRLRVAIELDCDARVLRDADARTYGDLLLNVAHRPMGSALIGATAFAERATQLERRIRHLPRHRHRTTRLVTAMAAIVALIAVSAAWAIPHPALPPLHISQVGAKPSAASSVELQRNANADAPTPPTQLGVRDSQPGDVSALDRARKRAAITQPQTAASNGASDSATQGARTPVLPLSAPDTSSGYLRIASKFGDTVQTAVLQTAGSNVLTDQTDSIFKFLFAGVQFSSEQEARARDLLKQIDARESLTLTVGRATEAFRARLSRQAARDSSLRALLTNDADRALFDQHAVMSRPGGRGRSGGNDSVGAGPPMAGAGGRSGGGGGGRGGRGGGAGNTGVDAFVPMTGGARGGRGSTPEAIAAAADGIYNRFFQDITLTTQQEQSARQIIVSAQNDLAAMSAVPITWLEPRRRLPALVRLDSTSAYVLMRTPTDVALLDLLNNESDRIKVRARIAVVR